MIMTAKTVTDRSREGRDMRMGPRVDQDTCSNMVDPAQDLPMTNNWKMTICGDRARYTSKAISISIHIPGSQGRYPYIDFALLQNNWLRYDIRADKLYGVIV
jgi:hypothetical protein